MKRKDVYNLIDKEREYQQEWKDTGQPTPDKHELGTWLSILNNRLYLAQRGWAMRLPDGLRIECIKQIMKIAAVCTACLEQYGDILISPEE